MEISLASIHWPAILASVVLGQIVLTIWFVVLFADPWAEEYGGEGTTKAEHTQAVPGYTYAIGAACVLALSIGLSVIQSALGIDDVSGALQLAVFLSATVFVPMAMPAYAFLRRWRAFLIGAGSQIVLVTLLSVLLAVWR